MRFPFVLMIVAVATVVVAMVGSATASVKGLQAVASTICRAKDGPAPQLPAAPGTGPTRRTPAPQRNQLFLADAALAPYDAQKQALAPGQSPEAPGLEFPRPGCLRHTLNPPRIGATMAFNETLARLRKERNMTQEELAARLYVTRQAVSRWENGETSPGIDMAKLIATVLDVPIALLLDMPDQVMCQSCGMPLTDPAEIGTEADGSPSPDFCKHCYSQGHYTYDATMDELIEACAPFLVQHSDGMTLDEAISFMGAILPGLKRWHVVRESEQKYGAEVRRKYGDEAMDESNKKLLAMDDATWNTKEELEALIAEGLKAALTTGDPAGPEAQHVCQLHEQWIRMHWADNAYSRGAHLSLAYGYLADQRFMDYYETRAGQGATQFLVDALTVYCS